MVEIRNSFLPEPYKSKVYRSLNSTEFKVLLALADAPSLEVTYENARVSEERGWQILEVLRQRHLVTYCGCHGWYAPFEILRQLKQEHREQIREKYGERVVGDCPECMGVTILRKSRTGGRFIGCSEYPVCHYTAPLPSQSFAQDEIDEAKRMLALAPKCSACGSPMIRRNGEHGPFFGCSSFPKCRAVMPLPVEPAASEQSKWESIAHRVIGPLN